jgi:hypothetical protein
MSEYRTLSFVFVIIICVVGAYCMISNFIETHRQNESLKNKNRLKRLKSLNKTLAGSNAAQLKKRESRRSMRPKDEETDPLSEKVDNEKPAEILDPALVTSPDETPPNTDVNHNLV